MLCSILYQSGAVKQGIERSFMELRGRDVQIMKRIIAMLGLLLMATGLATCQVPSTFWGIHYNHLPGSGDQWPPNSPLTFGTVRLWDSNTGWRDMEPGVGGVAHCSHTDVAGCDFSHLKTLLDTYGPGVNIILTLFKTPEWKASYPADPSCGYQGTYGANGSCTPPTDLNCDGTGSNATWINFVTALWDWLGAQGYAGRITYLEVGNEVTGAFWDNSWIDGSHCGATDSAKKMVVRMEQDARCIVKNLNCNTGAGVSYPEKGLEPAVKILTTSVGSFGNIVTDNLITGYFSKLLSLGGATYADVMNTHAYMGPVTGTCSPPSNTNCPVADSVNSAITALQNAQAANGMSMPIMFDEGSYPQSWNLSNTTNAQFIVSFVARMYTIMLARGIINFDWYDIDSGSTALYSNNNSGALTVTGAAVQSVQQWYTGKTFSGAPVITPASSSCSPSGGNVWTVLLSDGELAVWFDPMADTASCKYTPAGGFNSYKSMNTSGVSGTTTFTPGSNITLDNRVILLQPGSVPPSAPTSFTATPH